MEKYNEKIELLEKEELEMPTSEVNLYIKLTAYYLVQNKLFDAKFLWSRIPMNFKAETIELQRLNELQKSLTSNNLAEVLINISKTEWSDEIKGVMDDLKEITMENIFRLIGNSYTSILDETLVALTNLHEDQFKQKCMDLDWTVENCDQQLVIHPKKPASIANNNADSEYQLSKLTEFVSFLEN
ncbi:COP9 signalosome complex subunit 8 [Lucilia sericata]|uniref:COP9 signalosome complex subunit 8 n=1 Tax=Lucilia sericata TaxID=13632 RepID=UPI0018A88338|nr:COP9 signalosome complex subunit 8 [Lucilia sericata]